MAAVTKTTNPFIAVAAVRLGPRGVERGGVEQWQSRRHPRRRAACLGGWRRTKGDTSVGLLPSFFTRPHGVVSCRAAAAALCSLNGVGPQTRFVLWKGVVERSHNMGLWSTL